VSDANTLASHYYCSIVCHFDFIIYFLSFWKKFEICVGLESIQVSLSYRYRCTFMGNGLAGHSQCQREIRAYAEQEKISGIRRLFLSYFYSCTSSSRSAWGFLWNLDLKDAVVHSCSDLRQKYFFWNWDGAICSIQK
jgi:hypothetical protein